ncbi:hypothetical protein H7X65_00470 [Candidatus Parcubacteria bacterium]|nr:hypothetical protein [Candidatus Parcubacteria bacterium]
MQIEIISVGNLEFELYYYGHSADPEPELELGYVFVTYSIDRRLLRTLGTDLKQVLRSVFQMFPTFSDVVNASAAGQVRRNRDIPIPTQGLPTEEIKALLEEEVFATSAYAAAQIQVQTDERDFIVTVRSALALREKISPNGTLEIIRGFDATVFKPDIDEIVLFRKIA